MENSTDIAEKAEALYETRVDPTEFNTIETDEELVFPSGPTEVTREVKVRRVQRFFRKAVLESYNNRCAISGLAIPELLVASHIIPWAEDESRRADPTNGIALNALYDKAFDRHLISFDENFRLVLSHQIKAQAKDEIVKEYFLKFEGAVLEMPYRFVPDISSMNNHLNRTKLEH